ncbi:MAG: biosynthetic arginine decarboxylase [Planctomycetales bacterium]|nr:biosynthetic arginine decarboxylase [Planctomycetales bacterium]
MLSEATQRWSSADTEELYDVNSWGKGYFSVSDEGEVCVHPYRNPNHSVNLKELIDRLKLRGLDLPILLRFNDILRDRIDEIHSAFDRAIADHDYKGTYRCVYPIKVNQQRQVVEQILEHGKKYGYGLEAGSKPELLAVIAISDDSTPIICNGFKDDDFIEMAMLAQKIGRHVIPVVERFTELELILKHAERIGVRPQIGMRVKLASRGSGRWQSSGGYRSKFGLQITELLRAFELLAEKGMADCFKLLHFHLGSQITNIRHVKGALIEGARVYTDLASRGAGLEYLDVGGGLGVDYDGSQSNFESSMNYTLQEYANDVIYHVQSVCNDAHVPPPNILSESGRAIAAYHSILVFDVLGVSHQRAQPSDEPLPPDASQPLRDLKHTFDELTVRNLQESFHDAQQAFEMAIGAFSTGYLSLDHRALAEHYFWAICLKVQQLAAEIDAPPEEVQSVDRLLADTYFCNFSLFQSIPDSWAIKQLFPVMPIHRLTEEPLHRAVLGDITCDSDGKLDHFIDRRSVSRSIMLHAPNGQPYYIGAFLIGAYQEILGDLHNLFGDTNAVHVNVQDGETIIDTIIKGETVSDVLEYVEFQPNELLNSMQKSVELAVRSQRIDHEQAGHLLSIYERGLTSYTYLK